MIRNLKEGLSVNIEKTKDEKIENLKQCEGSFNKYAIYNTNGNCNRTFLIR